MYKRQQVTASDGVVASLKVTPTVAGKPAELRAVPLATLMPLKVFTEETMTCCTMTENDTPLPVFPEESVAVQVTGVVPIGKVLPDAGVHDAGIVPSTSSVAVTGR